MFYNKHNNATFTQGILWEIRFKTPKEQAQKNNFLTSNTNLFTPSPEDETSKLMYLNPQAEFETQQFLNQFQETCEKVKNEYIEEVIKIEDIPELSQEEYQDKVQQVDKSLEALNSLVEKFKKLLQKLKQDGDLSL